MEESDSGGILNKVTETNNNGTMATDKTNKNVETDE
jgi:hypothetical protein